MHIVIAKLYKYRFELFFFSLLPILFGDVFFPIVLFENLLMPILYIVNILSGILMISKTKKLRRFFFLLLAIIVYISIRIQLVGKTNNAENFIQTTVYFVFYILVTIELIKQVWKSKIITKNVIIGLMCGYISIGLLSFFMLNTIEMLSPGSFNGIDISTSISSQKNSLLYFSYITLLTIGYGEITPITLIAQKATILIGMVGQFYMVILTATIVGKYISQIDKNIK